MSYANRRDMHLYTCMFLTGKDCTKKRRFSSRKALSLQAYFEPYLLIFLRHISIIKGVHWLKAQLLGRIIFFAKITQEILGGEYVELLETTPLELFRKVLRIPRHRQPMRIHRCFQGFCYALFVLSDTIFL